jgi:hypothetical protein
MFLLIYEAETRAWTKANIYMKLTAPQIKFFMSAEGGGEKERK